MTQRFFIACRLPGLNEVIAWSKQRKGNWSKYAMNKALYESMIKADIKAAKLKPVKGAVIIALHWVEANARRDYSNIRCGVKFIEDALVSAKILRDDRRTYVTGYRDTFDVDKSNPGVWVQLEEV